MMSKAVFAALSRPMCPDVPGGDPMLDRLPEDAAALDLAAERARALARRICHDPLLGDREARLTSIRRRWYGWEEGPERRLD